MKIETQSFINDLGKVSQAKTDIANSIAVIVHLIEDAEKINQTKSGKLELERDIDDLKKAGTNLREGVFRLLVLGDMKRGKSTFLNALIGENVLPSDVNPCTAILTVLRYGEQKKA